MFLAQALLLLVPMAIAAAPADTPARAESVLAARRSALGRELGANLIVLRGQVTLPPGTMPEFPSDFYLQDETAGITVHPESNHPLVPGQWVTAIGRVHFLDSLEPEFVAERIEPGAIGTLVRPLEVSLEEALLGASGRLIRVRGVVRSTSVGETRDTLFIGPKEGRQLRAYVRRLEAQPSAVPKLAPPGSMVEATGVSLPFEDGGYQLRMRYTSDLAFVGKAPLVEQRVLLTAAGVLGALGVAGFLWIALLRRSIREQTAEIRLLLAKAQETSRLKTEFLANVSHELRTPMHGILGMQELLLEGNLSPEQRQQLETANRSTQHLLELLNELLDLSKIEAGQLALDVEAVDIRRILREVTENCRAAALRKRLTLEVVVDPDVPLLVRADSMRLRQVLLNLSNNAVKFTATGGIGLHASVAEREGRSILLKFMVTDTGIGIPEDRQRLIFDSFRQADGSISRRYGGTGLGLSIASKLVRLMGGTIAVSSRPGVGTTFTITVRSEEADSAEAGTEVAEPASRAEGQAVPRRVLLAEDNSVNRLLVQRVLEKEGHQVECAANGKEAVEIFQARRFDLVLMDLQMPVMDGLMATRQMRASEPPGSRTPIVAVSAHAAPREVDRCREAGMDEYLGKPFRPAELLALLAKLTSPERPARIVH